MFIEAVENGLGNGNAIEPGIGGRFSCAFIVGHYFCRNAVCRFTGAAILSPPQVRIPPGIFEVNACHTFVLGRFLYNRLLTDEELESEING